MNSTGQTRNSSLDIMKGIACIAVVLIHYNFKGDLGDCVKTSCRFAVPFFLFVSGYYLRLDRIGHSIRKLVNLELWSTLFYFGYCILFEYFWAHGKWMPARAFCEKYLSAVKLTKFLVQNDGLFNVMLWFIGALISCYIVVALWFYTESKLKKAFYLIIPLWLMMCICQEFSRVIGFKWSFWPVLGLDRKSDFMLFCLFPFRALPFFLFGAWVRRSSRIIYVLRIPDGCWLALAIAGGAMAIGEYYLLGHRSCQFFIGSYITAIALFLWSLRSPQMQCGVLAYIGLHLSMLVYVLQYAASRIVDIIARNNHWWGTALYSWTRAFLVMGTTLVLAFCVDVLMRYLKSRLSLVRATKSDRIGVL